jgi:uncharacterized protein (TIGR02421 family)
MSSARVAAQRSPGDPGLIAAVQARLAAGLPVRRTLPNRGRLHIDRPLPFLCVYRTPAERVDVGTDELVRGQGSYLVAPYAAERPDELAALVEVVVGALAASCGACLLLEIWSAPAERCGPPRFRVITTTAAHELATTVTALSEALQAIALPDAHTVEVVPDGDAWPPGLTPLIPDDLARRAGCLVIGLEVPPLYRSAEGRPYPLLLRALSHHLSNALQRGFFEFTRVQTTARPDHYQMMGRRRLVKAVKIVDRELGRICSSFDFLLAVTPINARQAWEQFSEEGRRRAPTFRYRMLEVDPELVKRKLYDLPLERLEDPVLTLLLRDKRREIDQQLSMLEDRDSEHFLTGSLRLYGGVDDALLEQAVAILSTVSHQGSGPRPGARCDAVELSRRAVAELDHYRRVQPTLQATVQVRDDVPGLMVSHGNLLIPVGLSVTAARGEALLQHEVGTHLVTYANGRAQPLELFAAGLAGYEALQEGLAVFAEYMAGGFDVERLRLIAARVVAVRRRIEGATFPALVAELTDAFALQGRAAFSVAMRVFRGGGLTKDAIYLRGLLELLGHLAGGGALEPLLVGKITLDRVTFVEELLRRQILAPPSLRPRWLEGRAAAARLRKARQGVAPIDLIEESAAE